jgi:para-aminobenzoate synthetase component I
VQEVDSLAGVEATLCEHGFFGCGAVGIVADVYLGYGLSDTLRRRSQPAPPEPCPLPAAAVRVRPANEALPEASRFSVGDWEQTWSATEHAAAVAAVREAIARGDVYQVNLVQHLSAPFSGDPAGVASRLAPLRPLQPRPLVGDGWAIVSASPEVFLSRRGSRVWTSPIKGTRPKGESGLAESDKDAAEHVMIVDLERNDLSRVCETGSVTWPELMAAKPLAGVEHLVSLVEGTLREDVSFGQVLEATFPGGSVASSPGSSTW